MRQEKILKDDKDLSAYLDNPKESPRLLNTFRKIAFFLLEKLNDANITLNLKQLNEEATKLGISSTVKNIKTILLFWKIKSYIKISGGLTESITITPQINPKILTEKQRKMFSIADYVIDYLINRYNNIPKTENNLILFSVIELFNNYNNKIFKEFAAEVSEIEEALLFLAKINSLKLEGGFSVLYMGLRINRLENNNRIQYTKENYKQLEEFYSNKIEQIHIVGEFANMMVKSYPAALNFVSDYFNIDYKKFLSKYFTSDRQKEIKRNITPKKYKELFESLSPAQKAIIDDSLSPHIVVAAGPGSGKTRVLVHKLASLLLMEDVKHEQLLMLTFSRSAALEFKKRLEKLIGNAATFVEIKTFHSYCFDLIGQIGKIEDAANVVENATVMIKNNETEQNKITKKILVIDEAQDMDKAEFQLVEALIEANENLKVIAVGDDDQNIYQFRGSSSEYFCSLITKYNARQYNLIDNYRSVNQVVSFSNKFAETISVRMKNEPIVSKNFNVGSVVLVKHNCKNSFEISLVNPLKTRLKDGLCCVLTSTNKEALSILGVLQQNGIKCKLIQSNDGFDISNIAELRFFVKIVIEQLKTPKIDNQIWENSKLKLCEQYKNSGCLNLVLEIIKTFEENYREKYLSDFQVFLRESALEDFFKTEDKVVTISTIHKAKGREFDSVFMYLNNVNITSDEDKRRIYVGITRAKNYLQIDYSGNTFDFLAQSSTNFSIDNNQYQQPENLLVALTHKDVNLGFFKNIKSEILKLRSGMSLNVSRDYLYYNGNAVLQFSHQFSKQISKYQSLGYAPQSAKIRFILSWFCDDDKKEYAIILPIIYFQRLG